jgi:hypothetical protein
MKTHPSLNQTQRDVDVLGSGGIAPRVRNLGIRWRPVVSFNSSPLYSQGKTLQRCPFDKRLRGLQSRCGRVGEETKCLPYPCPCQESNPGRPACSLVTKVTELPRLAYVAIASCTWCLVFWRAQAKRNYRTGLQFVISTVSCNEAL